MKEEEKKSCDVNEEKIITSYKSKLKIHIKLKDESWRNGFVEEISADFFLFRDDVNELEAIFFLELNKVEPFLERIRELRKNNVN